MTIKQFTESAIAEYINKGGAVHPNITLDVFKLVEGDEALLNDYYSLSNHYKEVNPTIGKTIRQHFDLVNDKTIDVAGRCSLIKVYMRFHKRA